MTRIRLIVMAVLAVFCVSAVAAVAASASENGEFVNSAKAALVKNKFTATIGAGKLETVGGTVVKCTGGSAVGKINSKTTGEQTVKFTGCTSSGLSCKSTSPKAEKAGEIWVLTAIQVRRNVGGTADLLLNQILAPGTTSAGVLEFECSGIKIKVEKSFLSNTIALKSLKSSYEFAATLNGKGVQNVGEYETEAKVKTKDSLSTSVEGKAFENSGEEATEKVTFEEAGEFLS